MPRFLGPLMLAVAMFLLLSCASGVKPEEMEKLKAENQGLKDEVSNLNKQIDELNDKILSLTEEVSNTQQSQSATLNSYNDLMLSLQSQISSNQARVTMQQNTVSVTLVNDIFFDEGSDVIKAEGRAVLDKVVPALKSIKDRFIRIEGYTDDIPIKPSYQWKFPSNWELSSARADAVVRYLQGKGINPELMKASGYGKYNPVTSKSTPEGRARNRRIEIELVPYDTRARFK
jgi:chemotaxis protein MotB